MGLLGELRTNSRVFGVMAARSCSGVTLNSVLSRGLDNHRLGAGELDHFRIAQPIRRGNDDFVARLARGENDVVAGMFAAARDDDLRRLVGEAVLALEFGGDGLAQFGNAAAGRVFGEPGGERLGGGVLDVLRRVEIRFARAETDDILAGGFHGLGLGINGQSEGRRQRGGAMRDFVIHNLGGEKFTRNGLKFKDGNLTRRNVPVSMSKKNPA